MAELGKPGDPFFDPETHAQLSAHGFLPDEAYTTEGASWELIPFTPTGGKMSGAYLKGIADTLETLIDKDFSS